MVRVKTLVFIVVFLLSSASQAVVLEGVKITRLYVQSLNGGNSSEAHAIAIDKTLESSCNSRLHIDPLDKEILSTLLAYKISDTTFHLMYSTDVVPGLTIRGHTSSTCKLFSIY